MLQISSVRLYVEGTTLKIDFRARWVSPYYNDEDIYVTFSGPGDPWKQAVDFHWHSGFFEYPDDPSFVKTITNDITKLKDGDYVLRVHYKSGTESQEGR